MPCTGVRTQRPPRAIPRLPSETSSSSPRPSRCSRNRWFALAPPLTGDALPSVEPFSPTVVACRGEGLSSWRTGAELLGAGLPSRAHAHLQVFTGLSDIAEELLTDRFGVLV